MPFPDYKAPVRNPMPTELLAALGARTEHGTLEAKIDALTEEIKALRLRLSEPDSIFITGKDAIRAFERITAKEI